MHGCAAQDQDRPGLVSGEVRAMSDQPHGAELAFLAELNGHALMIRPNHYARDMHPASSYGLALTLGRGQQNVQLYFRSAWYGLISGKVGPGRGDIVCVLEIFMPVSVIGTENNIGGQFEFVTFFSASIFQHERTLPWE